MTAAAVRIDDVSMSSSKDRQSHASPRDFSGFYRTTSPSVRRAVFATTGSPELADEATAEAMSRAYSKWGTVGDLANPEGWVYRTAINWATSRSRRRASAQRYGYRVATPAASSDRQRSFDLIDVVNALPLKQRTVIVLRYLLDWSIEDTAQALKISPGTVKSRTHRALETLHAELSKEQQ